MSDDSGSRGGTDDADAGTATTAAPSRDVLFVHSRCDDGYNVIRNRDSGLELGRMRALEEGQPIHGDVVRLEARPEHERLFDVEVLLAADAGRRPHGGPPRVATDAYRRQWELIFGAPKTCDRPEDPN